MATLKCLACGHDNNVGDESCSSCSSSLNLKLCSACEAINANNADRCHSCNAQFRIEPEAVTFEMDAPSPGERVEEASPAGRTLPAVWQIATRQARARSTRSAAAFAVLPLLVAGLAYYFYASSQAPSEPAVAAKVEPARRVELTAAPEPAPSAPVRQPAAEPKQQPPAVSGKIAPPRTAAAPSRSAPPSEPKRMTAAVTHTRAAGAEAPSRTTAANTPTKTTAAAVPVAITSVPAANASIIPVSEAAAGIPESKPMSVTHTKTDPAEAVTTTAPAAVTQVRTVPGEARNDEPAGCAPAIVALGLCKTR